MTNESHNTNPVTTKPRRWFRFRLRTLLVMVTLVSVPLGWVGWELDQRRREKAVIAWVEEMGGWVRFTSDFQIDKRSWWEKTEDKWFGETAKGVMLFEITVTDLSPLAELKNLKFLSLGNNIPETDLSALAELKRLESLNLMLASVSEEQVKELQHALPNCEIEFHIPFSNFGRH